MRITVTMQWDSSESEKSAQAQIANMLRYAAMLVATNQCGDGEITGEPNDKPYPLAYESTGEVFGKLSIVS